MFKPFWKSVLSRALFDDLGRLAGMNSSFGSCYTANPVMGTSTLCG